MKNFGETLKRLRKEKDMTQEQLAEYVNISPQSVSKWETNLTLPDITIIPMLANIFDVSADVLLGIDISQKKAHIEKIQNEACNFLFAGQYEEAEKLLRSALKDYPNSYELMSTLGNTLGNISFHDKARQKAAREEEIALCEKILAECTDDKVKHNAILHLCQAYCNINEHGKAMNLADKMPAKSVSNESLRGYILKGTEKYGHKQQEIACDMYWILCGIMYLNDSSLDGEAKAYDTDELIALHHKIIDIINILCEDGNFGIYNSTLNEVHFRLCISNIHNKDNTAALKHLQLAAKHAILFDAIPQTTDEGIEEYTSLLFRGLKVGSMKFIAPESRSQSLLNSIESGDFYSHLPPRELDAIKEELRKHTKSAV